MDAQLLSGEDAYRFGHILIRDAAYRGLPKETRADLHERFATFLAASTGDRVAEYEEIIGYHLEQAFRFRMELGPLNDVAADVRTRASSRLESAGQRALYRGDLPAALNLYQRAAALAEGIANHAELQTRVGGVLLQLGQFAEAEALFELARDTSREDGDERWAAHAEVGLEFVLLQTDPDGRASEIVELTERLVPLFRSAGDDLGLARTWRLRSEVGRIACRYGEKAALLEQALPYAQTAGEEREAAEIKLGLGNCFCWGPIGSTCDRSVVERCSTKRAVFAGLRRQSSACLPTCSRSRTVRTMPAAIGFAAARSSKSLGCPSRSPPAP